MQFLPSPARRSKLTTVPHSTLEDQANLVRNFSSRFNIKDVKVLSQYLYLFSLGGRPCMRGILVSSSSYITHLLPSIYPWCWNLEATNFGSFWRIHSSVQIQEDMELRSKVLPSTSTSMVPRSNETNERRPSHR